MAYGIEELAEMKVTGPVQGGDMVAKPNEMPVGAAALLSKMQKKNTPGIFKLPSPDKEMPSFMKVAAEGVEEQNTANLEDAEIIRIMGQYGVGPEEARKIYDKMIYGYERDEAAISPSDWRSILKMIESGMTQEEIDAQLAMNEVRNDVQKVSAFAPEGHQLAYITPDEGEILKMIGGSGETNPITGIKQYPQYGGATGASDEDEEAQAYGYRGDDRGDTRTSREASGRDQEWTQEGIANVAGILADQAKNEQLQEDIEKGGTQQPGLKPTFIDTIVDKTKDVLFNDPLYQSTGEISNYDEIEKLIQDWEKADVKLKGINPLSILSSLVGGPYKEGSDRLLREDGELTLEGLKKKIKELGGDKALESLKNLKPELYYKVVNPQTSGAIEELSKTSVIDTSDMDRKSDEFKRADALNRQIFEARETVSRGKDKNENRGGGGGSSGSTPVDEVQVTENVDVDPRAGAFNVGGTMKYTDDLRTGGTEMDVPLGRRFAIDKSGKYRGSTPMDLSEAVKYATLGGYGQLEPFQEYLARRRKELGEQPDEWFDEEGNVLFSKQA